MPHDTGRLAERLDAHTATSGLATSSVDFISVTNTQIAQPASIVFNACAGWYHPGSANLGVVMCAPHGYEELCVHRAWRSLAARLSLHDLPTLRFDYPGTGDSAGDDESPDRVEAWISSIHHAVATLRRLSGVTRVALVGIRMGALLAAIAAEQMDDLAALALLAPVGSGKAYARELRALAMMRGLAHRDRSDQLTESGSLEGAGFVYTRQTIKDLQALLPIGSARAPANDILLLHRPNAALDQDFHSRLLVCGASVTEAAFPDYPLLVRDADLSVYPRVGFGHVLDWLAELRGATQPLHSEPPASTALQLEHATETAVFLNSDRNLRGLTCEPHAPAHRPVLVFLNTGAIHHVGASRMTVTMARRLARVGFRSLRLDIGGIGESEPPPGRAANHPLNPAVVEDVRCALDWLQDQGHNECILIGLCSGAKLALETTLQDRRVVGQMLLNLQGFWPAPDSGTETESRRYLERLADRRVRTRFLYVEKDPGLDELQAVFGHDGERLCTIPNVSMTIMHDGDHVFSWYSSRRQLLSLVEHDLMEMLASTQVVRADRNEAAPAEI